MIDEPVNVAPDQCLVFRAAVTLTYHCRFLGLGPIAATPSPGCVTEITTVVTPQDLHTFPTCLSFEQLHTSV